MRSHLFFFFFGILLYSYSTMAQDCHKIIRQLDEWHKAEVFDSIIILAELKQGECCNLSDSLCTEFLRPLGEACFSRLEVMKGIDVHLQLIKLYQDLGWEDKLEYISLLAKLSVLYNAAGQYAESYRYSRRAMDIASKGSAGAEVLLSQINLILANSVLNIPTIGDKYFEDLYKLVDRIPGIHFISKLLYYHTISMAKATYLLSTGRSEEAKVFCENQIENLKPRLDENNQIVNLAYIGFSISYASALLNAEAKEIEKAIKVAEQALDRLNNDEFHYSGKYELTDATFKSSLHAVIGKAWFFRGELEKAKKNLNTSRFLLAEVNWEFLNEILGSKEGFAQIYAEEGKVDSALYYFNDLFAGLHQQVDEVMDVFSVHEKEALTTNNEALGNLYWSFASRYYLSNPNLITVGYNHELYRKRIVFDEWKKVLELARKEKGNSIDSLISQWELTRRKISFFNTLPLEELTVTVSLNTLRERADNLERQLSEISPSFKQSRSTVTYEMIRSALKPDEALVEFLEYTSIDESEGFPGVRVYATLIIKSDQKYPEFVPLFSGSSLDSLQQFYDERFTDRLISRKLKLFYGDRKLYNLVWSAVEPHLHDIKKVYYAPAGALHGISLQALKTPDRTTLLEKYDLKCVSSGRDLVSAIQASETTGSLRSILAFGDIDYDTTCYIYHPKAPINEFRQLAEGPVILRGDNYKYKALPFTATELDNLKSLTEKYGLTFTEYRRCEASEDQFKKIGQFVTIPSILHFATHGFFKRDMKSENNYFTLIFNPLFRSGVALAGANGTGDPNSNPPVNKEDGVLTAYDIAHMDLSGVELVVLSACETGLGDVKNGEGVYGLQRAFKMAGARHLLISLWMVEDKAAQQFMNHFYELLFSGDSVYQAYQKTQKRMWEDYPDDPHKWAAFLLI